MGRYRPKCGLGLVGRRLWLAGEKLLSVRVMMMAGQLGVLKRQAATLACPLTSGTAHGMRPRLNPQSMRSEI